MLDSFFFAGEYLALTGDKLNGVEMIACGLATHYSLNAVCFHFCCFFLSVSVFCSSLWIALSNQFFPTETCFNWRTPWEIDHRRSFCYTNIPCAIWWPCLSRKGECSSQVMLCQRNLSSAGFLSFFLSIMLV